MKLKISCYLCLKLEHRCTYQRPIVFLDKHFNKRMSQQLLQLWKPLSNVLYNIVISFEKNIILIWIWDYRARLIKKVWYQQNFNSIGFKTCWSCSTTLKKLSEIFNELLQQSNGRHNSKINKQNDVGCFRDIHYFQQEICGRV